MIPTVWALIHDTLDKHNDCPIRKAFLPPNWALIEVNQFVDDLIGVLNESYEIASKNPSKKNTTNHLSKKIEPKFYKEENRWK